MPPKRRKRTALRPKSPMRNVSLTALTALPLSGNPISEQMHSDEQQTENNPQDNNEDVIAKDKDDHSIHAITLLAESAVEQMAYTNRLLHWLATRLDQEQN
jgi:hypothetical protein